LRNLNEKVQFVFSLERSRMTGSVFVG